MTPDNPVDGNLRTDKIDKKSNSSENSSLLHVHFHDRLGYSGEYSRQWSQSIEKVHLFFEYLKFIINSKMTLHVSSVLAIA